MKKIILFTAILLPGITVLHAQPEQYAGKYLGWMKMLDPKAVMKPYSNKERSYTAKQIGIGQTLACWLQQSYTPKGSLGVAAIALNALTDEYSKKPKAINLLYGGQGKTFIYLKKDQSGKWVPETNDYYFCSIVANGTIGQYMDGLSSEEHHYFYIPGEGCLDDLGKEDSAYGGLAKDPMIKKYISWYQPKGVQPTRRYVVLLCPNNVKPYVAITKGEFFDELRKSIDRDYKERIWLIKEQNSYNQPRMASFLKAEQDNLTLRLAAYDRLRKKYSARMNEPAQTWEEQLNLLIENNVDYFDNPGSPNKHYIYKFRPEIVEKTKSDNPQWILIQWDPPGVSNVLEAGNQLHESMLNNIDYDYIYNYFFDPAKVAGKPYKPRRSPTFEAPQVVLERSGEAKKANSDPNVLFFDDFSQYENGNKPSGWKLPPDEVGSSSKIVTLPQTSGKWLAIRGVKDITPKNLAPLPPMFSMEFDLAVPKDIPWGSKAFEMYFATDKSLNSKPYLQFRFRAGFMGRPGEITVNGYFGNGYLETVKADATGLSNDKDVNKVHVKIERDGEKMRLLLNGNPVADIPKACPASTMFPFFSFGQISSDNELQQYFISNFRISKK